MAGRYSESEKVVIAAPMSFAGSAKRIWLAFTDTTNVWLRWLAGIPAALITIALVWMAVFAWYAVFGLLVVPWRIIRRGGRRRDQADARHRETIDDVRREAKG